MSWESTITYYQVLNETIKQALGGLHSAKCILYSVDFEEIEKCQANGDWNRSAEILSDAAQSLEKAGADYIVICTNTMHKVADEIERHIHIPLLHIAEMTAVELKKIRYYKGRSTWYQVHDATRFFINVSWKIGGFMLLSLTKIKLNL